MTTLNLHSHTGPRRAAGDTCPCIHNLVRRVRMPPDGLRGRVADVGRKCPRVLIHLALLELELFALKRQRSRAVVLLRKHLALERRVPVVLDGVVSAAREELSDLCPSVVESLVCFDKEGVLLGCPAVFAHIRVELIVPALADLLAGAAWEVDGESGPGLEAVPAHELHYHRVLLSGPWALTHLTRWHDHVGAHGRRRGLQHEFVAGLGDRA